MKLLLNSKLVNFYLIVNFSVILILSHIKFLINIAKYIFDIEIFIFHTISIAINIIFLEISVLSKDSITASNGHRQCSVERSGWNMAGLRSEEPEA